MSRWIKVTKTTLSLMEGNRKIASIPVEKSGSGLRVEVGVLQEALGYGISGSETSTVAAVAPELTALAAAEEIHPEAGSGQVAKPPVTWIASPNFASRNGTDIDTIILHNTDGSIASAIAEFQNPATQKSAHYIVGRNGTIVQMVRDESTAWHSGNKPVNQRSVGIEIEASKTAQGMTSAQEASLIQLCRFVMDAYTVARADVRPHRSVKPTDCPGWVWKTDADLNAWKAANLP